MSLEFAKLEEALKGSHKVKVFVSTPMGSIKSFSSYSLNVTGEDYLPSEKRRGSIASISASKYRSEEAYGRTTTWHDPVPTAKHDADLLALLWNHAEELIRLAKLGEKFEEVQGKVKV